ncbi:Tll0287-like domain-containing protein [Thermomonas flagellata]|uniref:Tll0287-like domain-containing protein n=1 Tax=Thermomonas flagellata TaxID=2888524 RepID=UPI001F04E994|nr:DUF3365 domain-containing protein [Thermomonas flagellata]
MTGGITTKTLAGGALLAVLLAACSAPAPKPAPPPAAAAPAGTAAPAAARERAQAAARDFSTQLKSALMAKLGQGGTEGAIAFCHDEAPKIAARVGAAHGVRLGRVPVPGRIRNPANAAQDWQAAVLADFQARAAAGTAPGELVAVQDHGLPPGVALRMMRGIAVEPACLACHGKTLSPQTAAALRRLYPGDTATGFEVGDLRGALWVEVPAGEG